MEYCVVDEHLRGDLEKVMDIHSVIQEDEFKCFLETAGKWLFLHYKLFKLHNP